MPALYAFLTGRPVLVSCLSLAICAAAFSQELTGPDRDEGQKKLSAYLLNKKLVAKVTFPASKDGIDLKIDGTWNQRLATRWIKDKGVGVEVGEAVTVTAVYLRPKHIEIHLNGGGAGTMGDVLLQSHAKRKLREATNGKVAGGSRINLRFDRPVEQSDVNDIAALIQYLDPVVDAASLQQVAARQAIPDEFKEAAASGTVVQGMAKATVFAILGEPKAKSADISGEVPMEKWQYEMKDMKTRIVVFKAGKVSQVMEF